ncbi:Bug family tripartite tricarboxylate transporter substrate binding protein [Roseovarius mucosus]|uniref:Bug family tripartite tricarboxylate transporter substrate binding protein n=1 Tax=Roseovarius mucosus TaxID=215743 RepID=UPI003F6FB5F1
MIIMTTTWRFATAAILSVGLPTAALADFPTRGIEFMIPFNPGGGSDFAGRTVTQKISELRGWDFVIDNRAGAGGAVGLTHLSTQTADGYTLGLGQTSNLAINPALRDLEYDPLTDFTPIVVVNFQPMAVAVHPDSPHEDLAALIDAARADPGGVSMATPGAGTVSHLSMELLANLAGIEWLHIPYPGASPAVTDAMGGQVDFVVGTLPSILPHVRSGALRGIAVTSPERSPALPDIPTVAEFGYDGYEAGDWKAVVGPAGLDAGIVATLADAINEALADDAVIAAFESEGATVVGGSPEEFAAYLEGQVARWAEIVEAAGVSAD